MRKEEIEKRLENITLQLGSQDISFQAMALEAFNNLLLKETLTKDQKKTVLPFIEKSLEDPEVTLRTDCFKTACLLGSKDINIITSIYPVLFEELKKKNRFRSEIVINMICDLINLNNQQIQDSIKEVIKNCPEWFDEPHLTNIIIEFWKKSISKDFQFIKSYKEEIELSLNNYPPKMKEVKEFITTKLQEYEEYLKQLQIKKKEEAKKREAEIKRREKLKLKEEEEKKRKLEKIRKAREKIEKSIIKQQNETAISQNIQSESGGIEKVNEESIEEKSPGVSFTKLGLKRKKAEKE